MPMLTWLSDQAARGLLVCGLGCVSGSGLICVTPSGCPCPHVASLGTQVTRHPSSDSERQSLGHLCVSFAASALSPGPRGWPRGLCVHLGDMELRHAKLGWQMSRQPRGGGRSCCLHPGGVGWGQGDHALGLGLRGQSHRPMGLPCPVSPALSVTGKGVGGTLLALSMLSSKVAGGERGASHQLLRS